MIALDLDLMPGAYPIHGLFGLRLPCSNVSAGGLSRPSEASRDPAFRRVFLASRSAGSPAGHPLVALLIYHARSFCNVDSPKSQASTSDGSLVDADDRSGLFDGTVDQLAEIRLAKRLLLDRIVAEEAVDEPLPHIKILDSIADRHQPLASRARDVHGVFGIIYAVALARTLLRSRPPKYALTHTS